MATKVSSKETLACLFACEIRHNLIFLKFNSFTCGFHGTIFDI